MGGEARATAANAESPQSFHLRSQRDCEAVLAALVTTVEDWQGEWIPGGQGGELRVPVEAGLRRGFVRARVSATSVDRGSELAIEVIESRWWVHRTAFALLLGAAIPAVAAVLWPFYPPIAPLVPLGLVLGAAAWLAILARLRHRGTAEFVAAVEATLNERSIGGAATVEETPPPVVPR